MSTTTGNHIVRELSPAVRAFLEEPRFAVIATINPDGTPQQTVLWYLLENDEIMFNAMAARAKVGNLTRDPRVSVMVEDGLRFVRLTGTVRTITDRETTQADIRRLAARYDGEVAAEQQMRNNFSKQDRITYRLPVKRVYPKGF